MVASSQKITIKTKDRVVILRKELTWKNRKKNYLLYLLKPRSLENKSHFVNILIPLTHNHQNNKSKAFVEDVD